MLLIIITNNNIIIYAQINNNIKNNHNELVQLLNACHSMQGTFEQYIINQKKPQKTIGLFALQRPDKLRWEVIRPNKQLIIVNKNKPLLKGFI